MQAPKVSTDSVKQLLQFSQALGVLKHIGNSTFTNFKLTYNPYLSTRQFHKLIGQLSTLWQKLLFLVSQDSEFILRLYQPLVAQDEMIGRLLEIYKSKKQQVNSNGITFTRVDYYEDLQHVPKLTEYNLMSVGMQSNMQQFQQAKRLSDYEHSDQYPESATIKCFADTTKQMYEQQQLKGIFLFAISQNQANFLDQKRLQIQLITRNIRTKRATLEQMVERITFDQSGNVFYQQQLVSVVYYRVAYRLEHFLINGNADKCWEMKKNIQNSQAYSIPPVVMELANQKRMQAELTKPEVIRKYLSEEEAVKLEQTMVKEWEFDTMTEESFLQLMKEIQASPQAYILKPNMQGGGNNIYGAKVHQKLMNLSTAQRRSFILMEKIISPANRSLLMNGAQVKQVNCLYELSRYGAFSWRNGMLVRNQSAGFLIRAKPEGQNQGGIMAGVGSIVPWKFTN